MADLVACLSTGKGTWSEVVKLINSEEWENVYIITNSFGKEKFSHEKANVIEVNTNKPLKYLSEDIHKNLKDKLGFGDVGVNISSGSGKEHMALISALMKIGVGIRFVSVNEEGMIEL